MLLATQNTGKSGSGSTEARAQQAEILRRLGCPVGQGFLFARPMPADQCLEMLRDNTETDKAEDEDILAEFSAGRG